MKNKTTSYKLKSKGILISTILLLSIVTSGCTNIVSNEPKEINNGTGDIVGLANPASVHCEENGGTLELIFDNGESYGMCHFPNGAICEEREFFRKECFPIDKDTKDNNTEEINNENNEKTKELPTMEDDVKENIEEKTSEDNVIENIEEETKTSSSENKTDNQEETTLRNTEEDKNKDEDEKETIKELLENHNDTNAHKQEGLTEEDIDLMESIIEKLK